MNGHLKALLVTDDHHNCHYFRKVFWIDSHGGRPDGRRRAVDSNALAVDQNPPNSPQEHHVLFPGLEYLSFYDIGSTSLGSFPEMFPSRTSQTTFPAEGCDANNVNVFPSTSPSVAKLKVFETGIEMLASMMSRMLIGMRWRCFVMMVCCSGCQIERCTAVYGRSREGLVEVVHTRRRLGLYGIICMISQFLWMGKRMMIDDSVKSLVDD